MTWRSILLCLLLGGVGAASGNPWNGKVVLQAYWWDFWNNNYPNNWATYLADLAPRLREMGIDAVWIPPTDKNKNATSSVGYAPFDHYDLGDKYQGGSAGTRFGTKDNYLRAVAILHANGIEVIQDMVWNHLDGAGADDGSGGLDPAAPSNQYKNFRYACYATPGTIDYGSRRGRFPKNWENFHPNPDHNTEADDITAGYFGPDICYYSNARGLSSNCSYNPAQGTDYMRNGIRNWSIWLKKQTGVDGFRLDAAKLFETWATQDFVWNLANNAGFASGGPHMLVIGEYPGSAAEMDAWVDNVNSANGGTQDLVGTFDFSLRSALKAVIDGQGSYNLANLPGAQQNRRSRTVPFVNNHDTFRPTLDANGRYTGWDSPNELGGHIDPNDPRIQLVYAVAFAVDGSPQLFFEDLFDLNAGTRWTHSPTNKLQLPARSWLTNQIWCHQKLNFKDGAYKVRSQAADLLVIERSAHALVAVNDNWTTAQNATVQTDFGANVRLHDYSGANTSDIFTDASGRATITAPPCDGSNLRRGYSIWGPAGISGGFAPAIDPTTQEWEMADDLGDSHPSSLQQGGALPSNSIANRTVGKFFPAAGKPVRIEGFSSLNGPNWRIVVLNSGGQEITNVSGPQNLVLGFTPTNADFHTIRIRNVDSTNASQTVWVKTSYTSPRSRFTLPPTITSQPTTIYAVAGDTVNIPITATTDVAPTYQWAHAGTNFTTTASTLSLTNVSAADAGTYSATLSNEARVVQSAPITLTIYDDSIPQLANISSTPTTFAFSVQGRPRLTYKIQKSLNLLDWTDATTNTAPFDFQDNATEAQQFYRVIPQ